MRYIFILLLAVLCMIPVFLRNYEKQWFCDRIKKKDIFGFLYPVGLWMFDIFEKYKGVDEEQKEWAGAVYVRENPQEQLRMRYAGKLRFVWIGLAASAVVGIVLSGKGKSGSGTEYVLDRPDFGETKMYALQVDGLTEKKETISVAVAGQEPEGGQMQEVFDSAWESVKVVMPGENVSLEEIRTDLYLPAVTDYGIRVEWRSREPDYISDTGDIVAERIPEEGILVSFLATLSYASQSAVYEIYVRLFPPIKDDAYFMKVLDGLLKESEKSTRSKRQMPLPGEVEGKSLIYTGLPVSKPWWLMIFFPGICGLALLADRQNLKKEYEERNHELIRAYPSLLFKLNLMLGCGLTLRSAWDRIVDAYLCQKKNDPKTWSYLYEEMITVQNRIWSGEGEAAAYRAFGQSCKEDCYLRLGSYLEQNVRQGVSGLRKMLDTEMNRSLEERKNFALRMGEAMNTKLLVPMFLMLGVVAAVLITPAILSM